MDDLLNALRVYRTVMAMVAERRQKMNDLKPSLPIEEIQQYVDWLEDKYTVVRAAFESFRKLPPGAENSLERARRASQKEVIKTLLQHLRNKQTQTWENGRTPRDQLNALNLSSEEEKKYKDKLSDFIDPITEDYIEYSVHMSTPSVVGYFNIDTVLKMIENTDSESGLSLRNKIARIFIRDPAYQQKLPKETISLRDPFSRTELTAKNFSPVEIDFSAKLDKLIKQITEDRQALSKQSSIRPGLSTLLNHS